MAPKLVCCTSTHIGNSDAHESLFLVSIYDYMCIPTYSQPLMYYVHVKFENKINTNSQAHVLSCVGVQDIPVPYSRVPASTYSTCSFVIPHDNTSFPSHMFCPNFEIKPTM